MTYRGPTQDMRDFPAFATRLKKDFGIELERFCGWPASQYLPTTRPRPPDPFSLKDVIRYFRHRRYYRGFRKWQRQVAAQICVALTTLAERYGPVINQSERGTKISQDAQARASDSARMLKARFNRLKKRIDAEAPIFDPVNARKVAQDIVGSLDAERRIITKQIGEGEFIQEPDALPAALEEVVAFLKRRILPLTPNQTFWAMKGLYGLLRETILWLESAPFPRFELSDHELYMRLLFISPELTRAPYALTMRLAKFQYCVNEREVAREASARSEADHELVAQRWTEQELEAQHWAEAEREYEARETKRAVALLGKVRDAVKFDMLHNVRGSSELRTALREADEEFNRAMRTIFKTPTAKRLWDVGDTEYLTVSTRPPMSLPLRSADWFKVQLRQPGLLFDPTSPQAVRELRELVTLDTFQALVAGHISDVVDRAVELPSLGCDPVVIDIGKLERILGLDDHESKTFEATRESLRLVHEDPDSREAQNAIRGLLDLVEGCRTALSQFQDDVIRFEVREKARDTYRLERSHLSTLKPNDVRAIVPLP